MHLEGCATSGDIGTGAGETTKRLVAMPSEDSMHILAVSRRHRVKARKLCCDRKSRFVMIQWGQGNQNTANDNPEEVLTD